MNENLKSSPVEKMREARLLIEKNEYDELMREGDIEACKKFISKYPASTYINEVNTRIVSLDNQRKGDPPWKTFVFAVLKFAVVIILIAIVKVMFR